MRMLPLIWLMSLLTGLAFTSAAQEGNLNQPENLIQLYSQGEQALSSGDYVQSMYYFRRILNSEQWDAFSRKADLLYKIGILEENQGDSEAAAEAFGRLIHYLENTPDERGLQMYYFYALKYADALERAGHYKQAADVYWEMMEQAPATQHSTILRRLTVNYQFHQPATAEMEKLREAIMPDHQLTLGWNLAELYRLQNQPQKSVELLQELWQSNFVLARQQARNLVLAYQEAGLFEDLLNKVEQAVQRDKNPTNALLLKVELLKHANRGEEALSVLDAYMQNTPWYNENDFTQLVDRMPIDLLDAWLDLVAMYQTPQKAIAIARAMVEHMPMDVSRRQHLSDLLKNNGRVNEAIELWTQWAQNYANNPMAILNAVERLHLLGAEGAAIDLLDSLQTRIPPELAFTQGETLLQLEQFQRAFQAFKNAIQAQRASAPTIQEVINDYSERRETKNLVAALINWASGTPFNEVPSWARHALAKYGVRNQQFQPLTHLAKTDPNGAWYYNFALEARRQNYNAQAQSWLEAIDKEAIYHLPAQRELAEIHRQTPTIPAQKKAADLFRASIAYILDTTSEISLNLALADRLMNYAEMRLNAFQPGQALQAIRKIESASASIQRSLRPVDLDRLTYARARAHTQLADFHRAVPLLEAIEQPPYNTQALFLLARVHLAQQDFQKAQALLNQLVDDPTHWRRKNDAISLMTAMEPLIGESLELFGNAQLYQLQGRMENADPALRQLAVNHYGDDVEEWARYTIGHLYYRAGLIDKAIGEWNRLALEADHPVIHGQSRYFSFKARHPSGAAIEDSTLAQEILVDFPDTLFSDLVRIQN